MEISETKTFLLLEAHDLKCEHKFQNMHSGIHMTTAPKCLLFRKKEKRKKRKKEFCTHMIMDNFLIFKFLYETETQFSNFCLTICVIKI